MAAVYGIPAGDTALSNLKNHMDHRCARQPPGNTPAMKIPGSTIMVPVILILFLAAVGCTSRTWLYENTYEGLKMREQIVNPADEPVPPRQPDYSEYKREREKILEENKE